MADRPKFQAARTHRSEVTYIMAADGDLLAEIHLGRFTPGKFEVRLRQGLDTFVGDSADHALTHDTIEQAAQTVDLFLNCGAKELIAAMPAPQPGAGSEGGEG